MRRALLIGSTVRSSIILRRCSSTPTGGGIFRWGASRFASSSRPTGESVRYGAGAGPEDPTVVAQADSPNAAEIAGKAAASPGHLQSPALELSREARTRHAGLRSLAGLSAETCCRERRS